MMPSRTDAKSNSTGRGSLLWRRVLAVLTGGVLLSLSLALPTGILASEERYDYDAVGRLVRMVDGAGQVTEYAYDAVGNLLQVRTGVQAHVPVVVSVTPDAVRRADTVDVVVVGEHLHNIDLLPEDPALRVSAVDRSQAERLSFRLSVLETAVLGASRIVLRNAIGAASLTITVLPQLPVLSVQPMPLAVPPDGVPRGFVVTLDHADVVEHHLTVTSDHPHIADVSPAGAIIPAGSLQASFQVTGRQGGQTVLRLSSPSLAGTAVPVFVTTEFAGINTAHAAVVGVLVEPADVPPGEQVTTLGAPAVGITFGPAWVGTEPRSASAGSSVTLTLRGQGLATDATVTVLPSAGVAVGEVDMAPDGSSLRVPLAVAEGAARGPRRLVLQSGGRTLIPAQPGADVLQVVDLGPRVDSIEPILGVRGQTVQNFVVRGQHLGGATAVVFDGAGVVAGSHPQVNAAGTELTTSVHVSAVAELGPRTVTVHTLAGASVPSSSSANVFTVVDETGPTYAGLHAPHVGVLLASTPAPGERSLHQAAPPVGISVGPVVSELTPPHAAIGQVLTLTLNGRHLSGIDAVAFVPADGLAAGAIERAPDGSWVRIPLQVAPDAPRGLRRIEPRAGGVVVPFAGAAGDRLAITAPTPVLTSVSPIVVEVGRTVGLVLRGQHLHGATHMHAEPSTGITFGQVGVNTEGDVATVLMAVAPDAAPGPRVFRLVAPAGASDALAGPHNTVTLVAQPGLTYDSFMSPTVGVLRDGPSTPDPVLSTTYAALVGVDLADDRSPPSLPRSAEAAAVGTAIGPVSLAVQPRGVHRGASSELRVEGIGLSAQTMLSLVPAQGITLDGPAQVSPDGRLLVQPITVDVDAPVVVRRVVLSTGADIIPSATPAESVVAIGVGPPEVVSLTPILARQGETVQLTIRGHRLGGLVDILADPASGLVFDSMPVVASDGTRIDLQLRVDTTAAVGARVIQVRTLFGASAADASAANTFTVFPP